MTLFLAALRCAPMNPAHESRNPFTPPPTCIFTFSHVYYFHFPLSTYTFNSPKYLDIFQRRGHAHIFSDKNPLKFIRALIFFVSFQYLSVMFNFTSAAEATSFRFHKNKRDVSHIEWMNHLQKNRNGFTLSQISSSSFKTITYLCWNLKKGKETQSWQIYWISLQRVVWLLVNEPKIQSLSNACL